MTLISRLLWYLYTVTGNGKPYLRVYIQLRIKVQTRLSRDQRPTKPVNRLVTGEGGGGGGGGGGGEIQVLLKF